MQYSDGINVKLTNLSSKLTYPFLDKFRRKINAINEIDDIETIRHLPPDATKSIEDLDHFSQKNFTVLNKRKPKQKK